MKMKGKLVLFFGVLLAFSSGAFPCYAQSQNNDQRIVGTWVNDKHAEDVQVFNSDGTGYDKDGPFTYEISGNELIYRQAGTTYTFYYSISTDGRTMVLIYTAFGISASDKYTRRS
ncbi:MAG: hypothetical protein LBI28_08290 [Treponema sp.]|nr:hypothetical protein [Treponema sp.]